MSILCGHAYQKENIHQAPAQQTIFTWRGTVIRRSLVQIAQAGPFIGSWQTAQRQRRSAMHAMQGAYRIAIQAASCTLSNTGPEPASQGGRHNRQHGKKLRRWDSGTHSCSNRHSLPGHLPQLPTTAWLREGPCPRPGLAPLPQVGHCIHTSCLPVVISRSSDCPYVTFIALSNRYAVPFREWKFCTRQGFQRSFSPPPVALLLTIWKALV